MGKVCKVDVREIEQLKEKLKQFENFDKKAVMVRTIQEIAKELVKTVKTKTPVDTGKLKDSWEISVVRDHGDYVEVYVYNNTDYASHVEYGHKQEVGRYVHAIRRHLVRPYVEGRFFLKKSVEIVDDKTPAIIKRELEKALKDLLNAK